MQNVPLRHQDVLSIADSCFIFERVGIEEALAAQQLPSQAEAMIFGNLDGKNTILQA